LNGLHDVVIDAEVAQRARSKVLELNLFKESACFSISHQLVTANDIVAAIQMTIGGRDTPASVRLRSPSTPEQVMRRCRYRTFHRQTGTRDFEGQHKPIQKLGTVPRVVSHAYLLIISCSEAVSASHGVTLNRVESERLLERQR